MKVYQTLLLATAGLVGVSSAQQNFTGAIYGVKAPGVNQVQQDFSGLSKRSMLSKRQTFVNIYKMDMTCLNPAAQDPAIKYDNSAGLETTLDYSCVAQSKLCKIAMDNEAAGGAPLADKAKCDEQLKKCRRNYGNTTDQPPPPANL